MSVEISWDVERPEHVSDAALVRAAQAALTQAGRLSSDFEVVFVSDDALADLHGRFLQDSSPTDVIAFDLGEDGQGPAGEVYVSLDCARRVAKLRRVPLERELALYVIHGCLHLCGFDDHDDAEGERMRRAESELLAALGYPEDPAPHEFGSS